MLKELAMVGQHRQWAEPGRHFSTHYLRGIVSHQRRQGWGPVEHRHPGGAPVILSGSVGEWKR
jgi:hypothetical protein